MKDVRKKRVLYVCGGRSFYVNALPRKLAEVARIWEKLGYDVEHICGGDITAEGNLKEVKDGGSGVRAVSKKKNASYMPASVKESISEWRDIKHDAAVRAYLSKVVKEEKPDLIWERSSRLHSAGLQVAKELGVPYVLEWKDHLVNYRHSLFRDKALKLEMEKNSEADYLVVESEVLREQLAKEGVQKSKIIVAHNAVDFKEFGGEGTASGVFRNEIGVGEDTVLVGYLGSYAFYHDTVRLILAADYIRKNHPEKNIHFLMVGAGLELEETRNRAEELGLLNDTVTMLPRVAKDEVPNILASLDIAVLPGSTDIICPIKIQEYMASGLPSVVPDYQCNREVIEDGVTGRLFTPGDEVALAESIIQLSSCGEGRRVMGQCAQEVACSEYSWEATWGNALDEVFRMYEPKND